MLHIYVHTSFLNDTKLNSLTKILVIFYYKFIVYMEHFDIYLMFKLCTIILIL